MRRREIITLLGGGGEAAAGRGRPQQGEQARDLVWLSHGGTRTVPVQASAAEGEDADGRLASFVPVDTDAQNPAN
jgi:hypothetical protein